jgi:hypothetical protein
VDAGQHVGQQPERADTADLLEARGSLVEHVSTIVAEPGDAQWH